MPTPCFDGVLHTCTHSQSLMTHKALHNPDISRNLAKGQWSIRQIYKVLEKKWYYSIRELLHSHFDQIPATLTGITHDVTAGSAGGGGLHG